MAWLCEAPDLVLGGFGAEDDGRIYSEPSLSGSDILFYSNDVVQIDLDEDNNSTSAFNIRNGANTVVWTVSETGLAVAAGASATAVTTDEHDQRLPTPFIARSPGSRILAQVKPGRRGRGVSRTDLRSDD
ncbi:MAG: hypothetical protein IPO15_16135 [Anaerolineae bacterium]|uniref:hypothetical protein n=1 Tax=Candidatus Amarolinea dominans TaxID=3140696 RepID=UPI003136C230|nr:hypothetical protein [Anaerolineae bacterium]